MARNIYFIPTRSVEGMRRKAKRIKKDSGITHQEALDLVARQSKVFDGWHNLMQAAKLTELSEHAFRHGFVFAMDMKDADYDHSEHPKIVPDEQVVFFVLEQFKKSLENVTQSDIYFIEELEGYAYFRYEGEVPATLDLALEIVGKAFFFPPQYIWLQGKPIDPLEENDGVLAGDGYVVFRG